MQYNAALAFFMIGLGMLTYNLIPRLSFLFGAVVFLIAGLTLLEYIFLIDLGIDQFFIKSYNLLGVVFPGRMAPATAFYLAIGGWIILSRPGFLTPHPVNLLFFGLSLLLVIVGMIGIWAYLTHFSDIYGWRVWVQMAPLTSFGFILVGSGLSLFLWYELLLYPIKKVLFLPVFIIIVGILSFILLWQSLVQNERHKIMQYIQNQAYFIQEIFTQQLNTYLFANEQMEKRFSENAYATMAEWKSDAENYFHFLPASRAFLFRHPMTKDGALQILLNPTVKDKELLVVQDCLQANRTHFLTGNLQIRVMKHVDQTYLCLKQPVASNMRQSSFASLINLGLLMDGVMKKMPDVDYFNIILYNEQDVLYQRFDPKANSFKLYWQVSLPVSFNDFQWTIQLWPNKAFLRKSSTLFPIISLLLGLFITLLLALAVREFQIVKEKEKKLRASKLQLQQYAFYDGLTGLMNRHAFNDAADHLLAQAKRRQFKLAVLFIDLDYFKEINDSLGHTMGDQVLIETAKRLKQVLRKEDLLCRFGGDEFAVLITGIKSKEDAKIIADKIISLLNENFSPDNATQTRIRASIGIAFYPESGNSIAALLNQADIALLQAKNEGKSRVKVYTP